ncbi:MAG: MFS transporter [Porticoccaceae bacterium]|nr:MFS transporter [Porticoccaceae bacterium]
MQDQDSSISDQADNSPKQKQENQLLSLACNLIIPSLILTMLSDPQYLGIKLSLIVALAFPIIYGGHYLLDRGKLNPFSALGIISVGLTGGISLMELDVVYIAIKEAAVPAIIGLATLISLKTSQPLIRTFLLNDNIFETKKITQALQENNSEVAFDKLLVNASWILAGSFLLSSILNYLLAVIILTADPGTVAWNEQLGKMTALSFPVIALPATLVLLADMYYLFRGITKLTGMSVEDILKQK